LQYDLTSLKRLHNTEHPIFERTSVTFNMSMSINECQTARDGFPKLVPNISENVFEQFKLTGQTVVVNGAADGIGLAVAQAVAEAGANVALWYNSNDAAISKGKEIAEKWNVKAKAYKVNVSSAEQIQQAIAEVMKDFGQIDVFVANAGMGISKPILEMTLEEYRLLMSVNVDGVFYCAKYAGEVFRKQGKGNLIITSSISAHIVNVPIDQPVYNMGKAAITHLGKSLAREWREFARVNIVSPGFFDTKMGAGPQVITEGLRMTPLGRQGNVKEIKGVFLWLASDASTYVTGADILIDGGYVLP
jgi:NAD(P)-dependent dehydrogenase (short-subunit alcohol dehydrogenase family)